MLNRLHKYKFQNNYSLIFFLIIKMSSSHSKQEFTLKIFFKDNFNISVYIIICYFYSYRKNLYDLYLSTILNN